VAATEHGLPVCALNGLAARLTKSSTQTDEPEYRQDKIFAR